MEVILILISEDIKIFLKKFSNDIFHEIKKKVIDNFKEEYYSNINKFGPNFNKKLRSLCDRVFSTIKTNKIFDNVCIEKKLKKFFNFFLKKAVSCYLRFDDYQQLIEDNVNKETINK